MLKRIIALALALVMLCSAAPLTVLAEEAEFSFGTETKETEAPAEETEAPVEETEAPADETEAPAEEETEEENKQPKEWVTVTHLPYQLSADAMSAPLVVTVGKGDITINVTAIGTSGTAQLYRCDAETYMVGDPMVGMSEDVVAEGELLCDYECGTAISVNTNRYQTGGADNLYCKYYVVQDGTILAGPVYASQIHSIRSQPAFPQVTKKGLTMEDSSTLDFALDMGVSNTVINMDLCTLILANEDENGNPIDNSQRSDVIEFECNGEIFYFDAAYVQSQDNYIASYSRHGINVTLVLIAWAKTYEKSYPAPLLYLDPAENRQTMAFNTSTQRGREYWVAAMEFLANRYSRPGCLVDKFIVNNEIDYTYDWSLLQPNKDASGKYQRVEINTFMEEFARSLRLANMAVKKYNSEAKVLVSLTHNWAMNCYDSYRNTGNTIRLNSYAPRDILDWLLKYEKARGDYNWGLAVHPYPIGTTSSRPTVTDPAWSGTGSNPHPIDGTLDTPWITAANLEVYQLYLQQPKALYNGELRTVSITEAAICNLDPGKSTQADYQRAIAEQAASIAQYYYRSACIDCIDAIAYFQPHDQASYMLGLMESDGTPKPAYNVWKYVDTNLTYNYANKYLPYISSTATSYKDIMPAVESDFDWDVMWDEDKIMVRTIETGTQERSIATDKTSYGADEPILVTATGEGGDIVGIFKAGEDPATAMPIFSYPVTGTQGNVKFRSGNTYDLLAYGTITPSRSADALMKAGDYQIVLVQGDTGECHSIAITITANYSFGSTELSLATNKDTYACGEEIIVTATGNEKCWVGIYGADDAYGLGATTSIYWYWVTDAVSGKPTILQSTTHNTDSSNASAVIDPGEYIIYLFDGSHGNDYNAVMSKTITIETSAVAPLNAVSYTLDNETDGFANGSVVITKSEDNETAQHCVLYWGDAEGKPLAGYTGMAMFRLNGSRTVYRMPEYTVIPEGAVTLLAYGSDGASLSADPVSCTLPEGCNYIFDEEPLAEFQVISDTHVTTDDGATGEVRLSNQHLTMMLEDVAANSPESIGIFISGDIVNTGREAEYNKFYDLYQRAQDASGNTLPGIHISIGNHDWMQGNPGGLFQRYAAYFNGTIAQPENVYYDEVVGGYHFIYLGGEEPGLRAVLSNEQLDWFDNRMKEISEEEGDKPVFVLLHQSFYNTVSGSLPGQGWDGVANEARLQRVLKKYGQIILLNGHSHWELNSESCMYGGGETTPVALNTASVGYLWTSYNYAGGEFQDGTEGYFVRVYEDKVVFLGRDFENSLFLPSALFVIQENKVTTESDAYQIGLGDGSLDLKADSLMGGELTYTSDDSTIATVTPDGTVIPKASGEVDIVISAPAANGTHVMSRKRVTIRIGEADVRRIAGSDRIATAISIAETMKQLRGIEKFDAIVLASALNFPDALSGSYLAAVKNAPILLTAKGWEDQVSAYIQENLNPGGTVYLLGGTSALPESVTEGLDGIMLRRVWGSSRFETNLAILKAAGVKNQDLLVCTGYNFADSLSASAANLPILLVGDKLSADQLAYLDTLSTENFYIIGGTGAVSEDVEAALAQRGNVKRIGGSSRFETSVLVAETFFREPESAVVAYAMNFPDGLCGGPLAVTMGAPLILTANGYEDAAVAYTSRLGIRSGEVLGGTKLVSDNTAKRIFAMEIGSTVVPR